MTEEQAIKGLKENLCSLCAYGSQNMDSQRKFGDLQGCLEFRELNAANLYLAIITRIFK